MQTLQEREWVRIVGHKEVPGRPSMLGTTRQFLDYFNLSTLNDMPPLADIQDIDSLYPELNLKASVEEGVAEGSQQDSQQGSEQNSKQDVDNKQTTDHENKNEQPVQIKDQEAQQE